MRKAIVGFLIIGLLVFSANGCDSSGNDSSGSGSSHSLFVTVTGLVGSGLTLQNNGRGDLAIDSNGSYTLATEVADGESYDVTVATQPSSPDQLCNVYYHSGTVDGADVTDIEIKCVTGRYNVVDTGQTACYDSTTGDPVACAGVGYDADYDGNQPVYTISGDNTMVTDNVTGLIWAQSPDTDGNGVFTIGDGVQILDRQFSGRQAYTSNCEDTGDVDDNGILTIGDAIWIFNFLFVDGPDPAPPFPKCGPDPNDDDGFDCQGYPEANCPPPT